MSLKGLTRQELEMLEIIEDPVKWAKHFLKDRWGKPATLRWYQEDMIKNKSLRKVSRMGRRTGKTFTMSVHMLWYAFTHANAALVIATPYEAQITLIFDQLRQFIDSSPAIQQSIEVNKRSPNFIKFKNGSYIAGFTAGTRSGAQGGSLRGQKADWLYMDEVDYMTDQDFDTIYAIALERPGIGIWVSSTPTGRRGRFYQACHNKENWKEFYYPTMVNPEWNDSMEKEFRSMFSQVAYEHEVLAEFGEETIGVFKKEFVDRARCEYLYLDRALHKAPRVMGIDWDKFGEATQIIITEWDQFSLRVKYERDEKGKIINEIREEAPVPRFKIIHRAEIPKSQFTYDNAVAKIIDLNQKFNVDFIYADAGCGEYQIEMLHKYGMVHPETGLAQKVKRMQFQQSIEVLDPSTKTREKKPAKPFMVNQTALLLERDQLMITEADEMIWRQMIDYQVVKVSVQGQPTYSDENEHALDAFMLSILGFQLEMPQLAQVIHQIQVARNIAFAKLNFHDPLQKIAEESVFNPANSKGKHKAREWDEPGGPPLRKVPLGYSPRRGSSSIMGRGMESRGTPRRSW